jgi:hypothetical protein
MILDRLENYDSLEASENSRFRIDQTQAVYAALICPCIDITYYLYTLRSKLYLWQKSVFHYVDHVLLSIRAGDVRACSAEMCTQQRRNPDVDFPTIPPRLLIR